MNGLSTIRGSVNGGGENEFGYFLLYLSSFLSPWFALFPTSAGLYEFILLILLLSIFLNRNEIRLLDTSVVSMVILILLGYTISIPNSQAPINALEFPIQFGFIIIVQLVAISTLTTTREHIHRHAYAIFLSTVGFCLYFFFSLLLSSPLQNGQRLTLIFSNPNVLALHISPGVIISLYLAKAKLASKQRIVTVAPFIFIFLVGVSVIIFSQSRRVMIYLTLSCLLIFGTNFGRKSDILSFFFWSLLFLVGVVTVSAGLYVTDMLPHSLIERMDVFEGRGSLDNRTIPLLLAFRFLSENIIVGAGYENYNFMLSELARSPLEQRYAAKPHNMLVIPFVEGGLFSGLGVIGLVSIITKRLLQEWICGIPKGHEICYVFPVCAISFFAAQMFGVFSLLRFNWLILILALLSLQILRQERQFN